MMNTKEKIILVAYKAFINSGFHNTSMQQLVALSGLSKGAFYHYFKNKEALYEAVINQYFLSFYKAADWETYRNMHLSTDEIQQEIHRFYLNFIPQILAITTHGMSAYYIMYFEAFTLLPHFKTTVQKFYNNLEYLLVHAPDNPQQSVDIATSVIARYEGILFLLAVNPQLKIETLLKRITTA